MQSLSPSIDLLRLTLVRASQFLKEDSLEASTKHYWYPITEDIVKGLDTNRERLYLIKDDLENLAIQILFRITTRLGSMKSSDFYQSGKEILKRLRGVNLPQILMDGINDFLLTPPDFFGLNKVDQQDILLLSRQISSLQEIMLKEKQKGEEFQKEISFVQPGINLIMNAETLFNGFGLSEDLNQIQVLKNMEVCDESYPLSQLTNTHQIQVNKEHSFCILDTEGNFVIVDKAAESLFEQSQVNLLNKNLFDLMIPFSTNYLKKTFGDTFFKPTATQAKTFSYTIYSNNALKKYKKIINNKKKESNNIKENPKISEAEKNLLNEENEIYYKYLQTLTSHATLINIRDSTIDELLNIEKFHEMMINTNHEIFSQRKIQDSTQECFLTLLLTRKAHHVQKFRYSMMREYDNKIIEMEKKAIGKLNKNKEKSDQK